MKANELRIGNIVYMNQNNLPNTIRQTSFSLDIERFYYPIPLTKEWLLRFGLKQYKSSIKYRDSKQAFFTFKRGHSFKIRCTVDLDESNPRRFHHIYAFATRVNYVHELQNLYYALSGEELIFKSDIYADI